ncbi:MAG: serine/threonine-protein kinase [Planctomycetota bacterium]
MPIETTGDFEIYTDRPIGQGAWGEVYQGRQISLDRLVAIKILKKEMTQDPDFVQRFLREATCLAKLVDEHIIHVYGAGLYRDSPYFAMEYVQGASLQKYLERGRRFSIDEIVYVAESVARALKTAWESPGKIIHRDIKPSNIMISYPSSVLKAQSDQTALDINIMETRIKVMDFGLAKITEGGQDTTLAGTIIGTPKYISPEQGLGNPADIRSDIYSLGIVLYELAAGRAPFESETTMSMLRHHIHDTALLPSQFNPDIPKELEKIIMTCIRKEPEKRYADPNQFLEDLTAFKQPFGRLRAGPSAGASGESAEPQKTPVYASESSVEATIISDVTRRRKKTNTVLYGGIAGLIIIAGVGLLLLSKFNINKNTTPAFSGTGPVQTEDKPFPPSGEARPLGGPPSAGQVVNNQAPIQSGLVPATATAISTTPNPLPPDSTGQVQIPSGQSVSEEVNVTATETAFKVDVWTNKGSQLEAGDVVFSEGDKIKIHFRANKDSYVYLYYKDAAGQTSLLFPNNFKKDNKISAHQIYAIPDETMNFDIKVTPPFGQETVKVVASLQPLKDMDLKLDEVFRDIDKIATGTNEGEITTRGLQTTPKEARAADTCTITTHRRSETSEPKTAE